MSAYPMILKTAKRTKPSWRVAVLGVLLCLALPAVCWADPAEPECAGCHPGETAEWQASLHGQETDHAAIACEECHGEYTPGHPDSGVMQLEMDASLCRQCHSDTGEQWQVTAHAEADVQCSSCHKLHTLETRLAPKQLCQSCHGEMSESLAHQHAGVQCIDCHLPESAPPKPEGVIQVAQSLGTREHTFEPATDTCNGCHLDEIHPSAQGSTVDISNDVPVYETGYVQDLAEKLQASEQANQSLSTLAVVSLGFGLGGGAVLGVIAALVIGYAIQRRGTK
jgi:hypothetical protein